MNNLTALVACALLGQALAPGEIDFEISVDRPAGEFKSGRDFEAALAGVFSASWSNVSLRRMLERISETQRVAVLLDRRLDPTREVAVRIDSASLRDGLETIAEEVGGGMSVVGNTLYVGPADAAGKLRTLMQTRADGLYDSSLNVVVGRRIELLGGRTFHWNDLDRPRELVERLAERYRLELRGAEQIPHDLWAGATLPDADAVEALSLMLIQFDLTFEWTDRATGIRIVEAPETISIERAYSPRGSNAAEAADAWRRRIPGLEARVEGRRVIVRGTAEMHESVRDLLRPDRQRKRPTQSDTVAPLANRRFTLRYRGRADALLRTLANSGVTLQYDALRLREANVDFGQIIEMDVEDAPAGEFFRALCRQLELEFSIDESTVTLQPK